MITANLFSLPRLIPALTACLLVACSADHAPSPDAPSDTAQTEAPGAPLGRLDQPAAPVGYRVRLHIDPRRSSFGGDVSIDIAVEEPVQSLWLHGNGLNVNSVAAQVGEKTIATTYEQVADIGVAQLRFAEPLPVGRATLTFDYTAPFNTNLEGLYKVTTGGDDYAFTQFEATSARLAFPGFDEPAFKVPFDISLEVAPEHKAVSNTPVAEETALENGNRLLRYETTKPLPTYLIAFAVGPLDEVAGPPIPATALRDRAIPLTGYAAKGKGGQLQFALQHTADIVIAQERYFGHPYPYAKLGLIAVPDFGAGAMENAGAITYREQYLLQTEATPVSLQQRFLSVHAHELAHQWFGNLVTPRWWDDIWLNEAFATWMAAKTMHQLQPEGGYAQRMLDSALGAMNVDRLVSTRQIRQPVTEHADIGAAFDSITYRKGGAVLSMLEEFVGEDAFKQGIQQYMQTHRFENADARDFVRAIAATRPDLPEGQIEAAFFSFLEQPGTPLVEVAWHCENAGATTVDVSQSRYLPLGSEGEREQSWVLPLCIAYGQTGERQQHCALIEGASASIELATRQCPAYIMPNANASGYYRWSLPAEQWRTLLASDALNERERLAAANSLNAAFETGELSAGDYLDLLPLVLASANVQVVTAPVPNLRWIKQDVLTPAQEAAFQEWIRDLYRPVYAGVSLDRSLDDADQIRLRTAMLNVLALLGNDDDLREELTALATTYAGYQNDGQLHAEALSADIRLVALRVAVQELERDFTDLLLEHFHNSDNAVLRETLLQALAESGDVEFIQSLRAMALTEAIRDNELVHIVEPLMRNPDTRVETWTWLRANMDAVIARYPSWFQGRVIGFADEFCRLDRHQEIERQLGDKFNQLGAGPKTLANTLESIQLCVALKKHHASDIIARFDRTAAGSL